MRLEPTILTLLSLCLVAWGGGSAGTSTPATTTPLDVTVNVAVSPGSAQPGGTAQVTAVVNNDPSNSGVTWSVSCPAALCGAVSADTTASSVAATYTAPLEPPVEGMAVLVTATSIANPAIAASASINVSGPIAFSAFVFGSSEVPAGTSTQLTATVFNDPANGGVQWSIAPTCGDAGPSCGTISPATSASGEAVTYTAPPGVPCCDIVVQVTASPVSAPSVQTTNNIIIPTLAVIVSPQSAQLAPNGITQFVANVSYPGPGVTWSVQCSAADCGTIAPSSSASGVAVTYTAPATVPSGGLTVSITAATIVNSGVTAVATVNLGQ